MQALIKRLDPTRPVTYNSTAGNEQAGINEVIEVRGWSYRIGVDRMDAYHAAHPDQPNVGSEQGSTITTRGIYANDAARCYMSAYDDNQTDWSNTAKQWASFFGPRPWLSGGFVWTGFDYRGEPTPYRMAVHQLPLRHPRHLRLSQGQLLALPVVVDRAADGAPAAALELARS